MFDGVQVLALAGTLKDIQRLNPKPLLHCLGCVLMVAVLLEVEPSPQSEVLSALDLVFVKELELCEEFIWAAIAEAGNSNELIICIWVFLSCSGPHDSQFLQRHLEKRSKFLKCFALIDTQVLK